MGESEDWAIDAYGEWDAIAGKAGTCSRCGRRTLVRVTADPYLVEVDPEDGPHEKTPWCYPCFGQRKDDV